ncbi:MAG: hypothetical protein CM1200mP2_52750 [Planctomycetaceae bacterium]|nr:MAG: hypothetical protein CM1200mP2_52750 [Planctomycetaceae bacterium]
MNSRIWPTLLFPQMRPFPVDAKLQQYAPSLNTGRGFAAMTERSEGIQLRALLQSAHVGQLTLKVRHQLGRLTRSAPPFRDAGAQSRLCVGL